MRSPYAKIVLWRKWKRLHYPWVDRVDKVDVLLCLTRKNLSERRGPTIERIDWPLTKVGGQWYEKCAFLCGQDEYFGLPYTTLMEYLVMLVERED